MSLLYITKDQEELLQEIINRDDAIRAALKVLKPNPVSGALAPLRVLEAIRILEAALEGGKGDD